MQRSSTVQPPTVHATHISAPKEDYGASRRRGGPVQYGLVGVAALLILAAALFTWYELGHSERIYKGVSVLGRDLSGMSREQATAALTEATVSYPGGTVALSGAGQAWTFAAADLGVSADVEKTLDAAMSVGRDGNLLDNLGTQIGAFFHGTEAAPILKQDAASIDKIVTQIATQVDKPAVDSKLEKDANGVVNLTASAEGLAVDKAALRQSLMAAAASVPFGNATLSTRVVAPKVTEAELQGAKAQALLLTEQPVVLKADKQSWAISPANLRDFLTLNHAADGTVSAALDNNALAAFLQPVGEKLLVEPQDATITIGKGTVTLTDDVPGQTLDAAAAIAAIQQAATGADESARTVTLPMNVTQAHVHTQDLQALYNKANSLVTQGLRLYHADDGYILRGSNVTGFIEVKPAQGGPGPLELIIDDDVLADRIAGVAYYINTPVADARFKMVNGVPTKVADARQGVQVDVAQSVEKAKQAIAAYTGGDRLQVDLVATVTEPNIKDSDLAGISTPDMLAFGQTSYVGSSANRAWNVELGTSRIDGTLIPPGGIFSTSDTIGALTLAAGFKMGYAIQADGNGGLTTVPAEAGGICQVATTLYHAVFRSGLHVVERNWHSYWIGLYGVAPTGMKGLDATIAPPDKDFRFQNNTGNWILIKASASKGTVLFQLYGVNPHWTVNIGQPVITNVVKTTQDPIVEYSDQVPASAGKVMVEHAQDGFSASISRVVTDSSGKVVDNWTAKSVYAPAHNRYLIGTGK